MQSPVEFSVLGASTDHGRGQFYLSGESQSPKRPFFRPMRIRCPRRRRASRRATPPFLSSPKRRGEPCVRPRTRTIPPRVGRIGAITRIAPTMSDHLHACRGEPAAAGVRPAQVSIHAPAPGRPLGPTLQPPGRPRKQEKSIALLARLRSRGASLPLSARDRRSTPSRWR